MTASKTRNFSRPSTGAAPYFVEELFFSRTDERGIIQSGNGVFQRVAHHSWEDLLKAPHKVIRHEDMPRGVFHTMWKAIQDGQPIGAYVKNRASDGLHYWVFAVITPIKGGYLSVRLKPTSPLLRKVEAIYATLLAKEKSAKLDPAASAELLLQELKGLGYPSYDVFMSRALSEEMNSRWLGLEQEPEPWLEKFQTIRATMEEVASDTRELSKVFESIRGIPYNMRILASRMEGAGGPISVISANYGVLSEEIGGWMGSFASDSNGSFADVQKTVETGLFLQCTAQLQKEMRSQFAAAPELPPQIDADKEARFLAAQIFEYDEKAQSGMRRVALQAQKFSQSVRDMKRLITGLGATRMMCKIEGARLRNSGESLSGVINQLDHFQESIEARLSRIDQMNRLVQQTAASLTEDGADQQQKPPPRPKPMETAAE